MRKLPETVQPPFSGFDKPAKERLIEASDKCFRLLGIRVANGIIAREAESNMDTLVKYFGHGDPLIDRFIKALIAESEAYWAGRASEHPGDPEAQLRWWLAFEEDQAGFALEPQVLLARTAAELYKHPKQPLLTQIEQYWHAERRRVLGLCRSAGLRDPVELADKLLLLVHGVRNERGAYGRIAPSRLLQQAGNDLMVAHGASSRPTVEYTMDVD